jgi:hypothetical protein
VDWIDLAQDREKWRAVVNTVMNLRIPQRAENLLISLNIFSFSRTTFHGVSFVWVLVTNLIFYLLIVTPNKLYYARFYSATIFGSVKSHHRDINKSITMEM